MLYSPIINTDTNEENKRYFCDYLLDLQFMNGLVEETNLRYMSGVCGPIAYILFFPDSH